MEVDVRGIAERFAGPRARHLLAVVDATVQGVIYGLIGTALAQGLLAAIGFWIAGVPQALLFGFLTFVLSFVPGAPPLVWGSVALWLLVQGAVWRGIFVAAWGLLLVSSIDNVLRPYLLGKTLSNLPVVLRLLRGSSAASSASGSSACFWRSTLLAVGYALFLGVERGRGGGAQRHPTPAPSDAD